MRQRLFLLLIDDHASAFEQKLFAQARAADLMATKSTGFEWSIKLIGDKDFYVGIASEFKRDQSLICDMDLMAILYYSNGNSPVIQMGKNVIHSNLKEQKTGDIINFQFLPKTKKLVIELVRIFVASNEALNRV